MIVLKIKEKGIVVDIPGTKKVRSPVELDISNVDLNLVTMYLRKHGIENYSIVSITDSAQKEVLPRRLFSSKKKKESVSWKDNLESRFSKLEGLLVNMLGKKQDTNDTGTEQITNKLEKLEKLSEEIIRKQETGTPVTVVKSDEPKIEELDEKFIPSIDIDGMTMKGSTIKTLQSDSEDADEAADLLSSIVKDRR